MNDLHVVHQMAHQVQPPASRMRVSSNAKCMQRNFKLECRLARRPQCQRGSRRKLAGDAEHAGANLP